MNDSIIELLNLKGDDLIVTDYHFIDNTIFISVEKKHRLSLCPICGSLLYSKGSSTRTLNHPVLQDGRNVTLYLKKRKYKCPCCGYFTSDSFSIAPAGKHSTSVVPLLILKEFKNLTTTAVQVAQRLNISDSSVHSIFMNSIRLDRLPLTEVISIDEVYLNTDYRHKYAMVIMDFITGDIIDIVVSRRDYDTRPYLYSIPLQERLKVKYLVCDMYNPYINFTKRYFKNAVAVVDCFHVVKWINSSLNTYYNQVKKKYRDENKKILIVRNEMTNSDNETIKDSRELHILKKYKYFLFSSKGNIDYTQQPQKDSFLNQTLDQYQKEKMFFSLDSKFRIYRDLKEKYFSFDKLARVSENKEALFESLVQDYKNCGEKLFIDFASILSEHKEYILNSYTYFEVTNRKGEKEIRRLSNGPIESFNNKPKLLKRIGHGFNNFEYFRLRLLWACRINPVIRIPSSKETNVHPKGKKRGKYKK